MHSQNQPLLLPCHTWKLNGNYWSSSGLTNVLQNCILLLLSFSHSYDRNCLKKSITCKTISSQGSPKDNKLLFLRLGCPKKKIYCYHCEITITIYILINFIVAVIITVIIIIIITVIIIIIIIIIIIRTVIIHNKQYYIHRLRHFFFSGLKIYPTLYTLSAMSVHSKE